MAATDGSRSVRVCVVVPLDVDHVSQLNKLSVCADEAHRLLLNGSGVTMYCTVLPRTSK